VFTLLNRVPIGKFNRVKKWNNILPKVIGSTFWVQACPGATGCGYAIVFSVYDFLAFHHRILTCQPALVRRDVDI
jgi:hypothetical protein